MRAAIFRNGEIVVDTLPELKPGAGQVLVKTLACGICGSDLHARKHARHMVELQGISWPQTGDAASLVTATVGVDGVATAFADLANPERHTKIIVQPGGRYLAVGLGGRYLR